MRIDDEIQTSFDKLCIRFDEDNAFILVSIQMMVRWHTSCRFNAEHILLQSGKFHFSKPQFYHSAGCYLVGRLSGPLYVGYSSLECEFESKNDTLTLCANRTTPLLVVHQPSSLPSDTVYTNIYFGGY